MEERMSEVTESTRSSAAVHGPLWGERAADWAEHTAAHTIPAWNAVAEATEIGEGTRVLDVGCGSGEFCAMVAERGGIPSGIDAAEGMIEVARSRLPDADLRVGAMESLPWPDDSFDVVTGFNSFQFAADIRVALAEAKRAAKPGGLVSVCRWGAPEDNQLYAVLAAIGELQPPPPAGVPRPGDQVHAGAGALEPVVEEAGLEPLRAGEVEILIEAPDDETLARALLAPGGVIPAIEHSGEEAVRNAVIESAEPFKQPDGSYRIENRFRYLISTA